MSAEAMTCYPSHKEPKALVRVKASRTRYGAHILYKPGLIPSETGESEVMECTKAKTNEKSEAALHARVHYASARRRSSAVALTPLHKNHSRNRLGINYYSDKDRVPLWKKKLYEPPAVSGDPVVGALVAREYNTATWCLEVANDSDVVALQGFDLKEVPLPLTNMTYLTSLNLSHNKLTEIPREIGQLTSLFSFDISFNSLGSLPVEIGQEVMYDALGNVSVLKNFATGGLTNLSNLDICSNQIEELPSSFSRLVNLTDFKFDNNLLVELPNGFSRWKLLTSFSPNQNNLFGLQHELCTMFSLTHLNLSKNEITELPQNIGKLVNLTYLDCSYNKLCQLPTSIVQLTKLKVLLLIDNALALLPSQMGRMSSLSELNLYQNLLDDLPISMKSLENVEIVNLDYNPLTSIPALIRDEGWKSIRHFLSSDVLARRKIKLRDHTQTVGQGVLGKDVPKIVELRIQLEEKECQKKKLESGHKFDFESFDLWKARDVLSYEVRAPKIDSSTWLLFDGEKELKKKRKVRQTEMNKDLFSAAAMEAMKEVESDEEDEKEDDPEEDEDLEEEDSDSDEEELGSQRIKPTARRATTRHPPRRSSNLSPRRTSNLSPRRTSYLSSRRTPNLSPRRSSKSPPRVPRRGMSAIKNRAFQTKLSDS